MTECQMDSTSAFNTRTVQRCLLLLDPARGKERLMKIQQHDGVMMVERQYSDRASPSTYGGGEVLGRGGAAP